MGGGGLQKVQQPKNVQAVLSVAVFLSAGWMGDSARHHGITGSGQSERRDLSPLGVSDHVGSRVAIFVLQLQMSSVCVDQVHVLSIKALDSTSITTVCIICICMQVYTVTVSCELVIKLALAAS